MITDDESKQLLKALRARRDTWRITRWFLIVIGLAAGGYCWYLLNQLCDSARNSNFSGKIPETIEPVLMAVVYAAVICVIGLVGYTLAQWQSRKIEDAVIRLLETSENNADANGKPDDVTERS